MMEGKVIKKDPFKRMKGSEVGIEWLENDDDAMKEPIVVETEEGLGMKMPPSGFTVDDVAEALGEDYPVEVIGTYALWSLSSMSHNPSENVGNLIAAPHATPQMSRRSLMSHTGPLASGLSTMTLSRRSETRYATLFR